MNKKVSIVTFLQQKYLRKNKNRQKAENIVKLKKSLYLDGD